MPDLIIKRHDTYPPLSGVLSDARGTIDLTNALSVLFIMHATASGASVSGICVIATPRTAGQVLYFWQPVDLAVADLYQAEFEIHWADGTQQTVPNAQVQNLTIEVDPDLNPVGGIDGGSASTVYTGVYDGGHA